MIPSHVTMIFYLGTHLPNWLSRATVPLFVSHRRLRNYRTLPVAAHSWALDSGAFTELSNYGRWVTGVGEYIAAVRRYRSEVGLLEWAAPMDYMCEPFVLSKTGLTVREHQRRTVDNLLELRHRAGDLPFAPVLQGWTRDDYLWCWELYDHAGVDLASEGVVGLGSVCRRQGASETAAIVASLQPLRLHGFGVKTRGLRAFGDLLRSADSMAWSFAARREPPLDACSHANCANCSEYASAWYAGIVLSFDGCGTICASSQRTPVSGRKAIMPQARRNRSGNGSTDTASPAQNRITVQLTADAGAIIDRLSQRMQADMGRTLGFAPDLSRAQVVTAILKAAEANPPRGEAQATAQELAEAPTA